MKRQDFYFDLPSELIAEYPLKNRSDSRLLCFDKETQQVQHHLFSDLTDLLQPGDLLIMNDSKVIPARFFGKKKTGGRVEFLVERKLDEQTFLAHIKSSKALKVGKQVILENDDSVEVLGREEDLYICQSNNPIDYVLMSVGHIPLPPYIDRDDEGSDRERYQTVYAKHQGSVAAPTAGLHFDEPLLNRLHNAQIETGMLTLHVGAGTFRPVRCESLEEHKMHHERISISQALAHQVNQARSEGRRVIAVGTTALRSLESSVRKRQIYLFIRVMISRFVMD